jgi:transposase-like protein
MKVKKCSNCKLEKELDSFHKNKSNKDGHKYECKECCSKENKQQKKNLRIRTGGLYTVYVNMKSRCYNNKIRLYPRYGGRGITVCREWRESPKAFFEWAMGNGHKKGLRLDRIDNDGNYCPENCRFVTQEINVQNSSRAKLNKKSVLEIRKMYREGKIIWDISKIYNINQSTVSRVVNRQAWKNI